MSDFSFLAVPNIEAMRLSWYIQLFGIALFFGVSLFFVIYFFVQQHTKHIAFYQAEDVGRQSYDLEKQLLQQKIANSTGKTTLVLFIEYVEKFVTSDNGSTPIYANPGELLLSQGFSRKEAEELSYILYTDTELPEYLREKIHEIMDKLLIHNH